MYNKYKKNNSTLINSSKEEANIALVGPVGCGKSALLVKYITRRFIGDYDPFYEGCWSKIENIDGLDVNVNIMDTYDQERKNLEKYLKWSDALVLVYSITDNQSFQLIQEYLENIYEILKKIADDHITPNENKVPLKLILLGNKIDLERYRQVSKQEVELTIEKYLTNSLNSENNNNNNLNIIHLESTSCDEYELVQNIFIKIVRDVRRDREIHLISNPLVINEDNINKNNNNNNVHIKHNSFKARFHSNHQSFLSKRSKSPKIITNLIIQDANHLNNNNNNINTVSIQPSSAGSGGSSSSSAANLISFQSNNITINNSNNMLNTSGSVKKNKFPFFTKILNKS